MRDNLPDPGLASVPMSPLSGAGQLPDPDHTRLKTENFRDICVICHIPGHSVGTFHRALMELLAPFTGWLPVLDKSRDNPKHMNQETLCVCIFAFH